MQKPQGYDEAQAFTGENTALPAGGYICKIVQANETLSNSGKNMLVLLLDIAEGEYKDYFKTQFDRVVKNNPDAKWGGTYRQPTEGKSVNFFKGLVTSIEVSNNFVWPWGSKELNLKGKLLGGIFGREQYQHMSGDLRFFTRCQAVRSVSTIREGNFQVPEDKLLTGVSAAPSSTGSFVEIDDDGDLPF